MSESARARKDALSKLRGSRFIDYPIANKVIAQLEDLVRLPKVHRMPNLLIIGETNNGKSMIINRFLKRHGPTGTLGSLPSNFPVLVVQAPNVPDEGKFYNAIMAKLYTPFRSSARVDQRQLEVFRVLDAIGLKILIIDEIHNILAGAAPKQQGFRNMLKQLGNELQIPVVGVGTHDAYFAIQVDKQLENRFEIALVPKWTMNSDYLRLLASFEIDLKLKNASNLTAQPLAQKLLATCEGTIGELARLLVAAGCHAIDSGAEVINPSVLKECGYISPSERSKHILLGRQ